MWVFFILAIIFLILWLLEKQKVKGHKSIAEAKAEADAYVQQKKAEGDEFYEAKHREALDYYWKKTQSADERVKKAEQELAKIADEKVDLQKELAILTQDALCAMVSVDAYENLKSDEVKNKLALLKTSEDELIKSGGALIVTNNSSLKRVVDSQKKQILRCFNSESASLIGSVTANNVDSVRTKLQR